MTVVLVEGLMGTFGTWLYRGLIAQHQDKLPKGVKVIRVGWTLWGGGFKVDGPCVIFSHSFGEKRGVAIAEMNKDNCKLLCQLDARKPLLGWGSTPAPKGVKTIAIYRQGAMQGYPVEGAENILLTDGTGHTGVPAHPAAWKALSEALR